MPADLGLLEDVYAFASAREKKRIDRAMKRGGLSYDNRRMLTSRLKTLQWAYAEAKQAGTSAAISAAIDVCRKGAMRFQDHPAYDPLWTL